MQFLTTGIDDGNGQKAEKPDTTQPRPKPAPQIDCLETLSLKSPTLSQENIADGWIGGNLDAVEAFVEPLLTGGLVQKRQVTAHPLLDTTQPIAKWPVGSPGPTPEEFAALANFVQGRWTTERQLFTVFVATKLAATLFGSHIVEVSTEDQWTHDLHIAAILTRMKLSKTSEQMKHVVGEGQLPKLGFVIDHFKDADMFIVDAFGQAIQVIEHAGKYGKKHLQEFHTHCAGGAHAALVKRYPDRKHRLYPDPRGTEYVLY